MTARKKPEDKEKAGRPTLYDPKYAPLVTRALRLNKHLTDPDLAELLDVSIGSIARWKVKYPEFREAINAGKDGADEHVAVSLYRRATGYSHPDVDIRVIKDEKGNQKIVKTPIIKHYPPDTVAALFWLKNRHGANWREKQDVQHSGELNVTLSKDDAGVI